MSNSKIKIRPKRSMTVLAILTILMAILSYIVLVAIAALCVYLPYEMSLHTTNFQVYALVLFGIAIAAALLWSLVPKRDKFKAPGPLLDRAAHPRLFVELDNIADSLDEKLPREIYLVGEMNAFVADRGGVLGFGSRRIMGLGLPLLSLLTVDEFRAILAHEFAHYYGGDTRLGPWVYKTRSAIIRVFENVGSLGEFARFAFLQLMYVVVTTILKWYFQLFMRVTNLISREQEFRADELACIVVGSEPLISGLRTIHSADSAWPAYWNSEISPVLLEGRLPAIGQGFAHFVAVPGISKQVSAILEERLKSEKTEPYDTHPPLRDRIVAAEKNSEKSNFSESPSALTLLNDLSATERSFVQSLNPGLAAKPLEFVSWDRLTTEVTIPAHRKKVATYLQLLQGITCASLPEAMASLDKIGSQIQFPKGRLPDSQQRADAAVYFLGCALGLTLFDRGGELNASPGQFDFKFGEEHLNPFRSIRMLARGELKAEAWLAQCQKLGISSYRLDGSDLKENQQISEPTAQSTTQSQ